MRPKLPKEQRKIPKTYKIFNEKEDAKIKKEAKRRGISATKLLYSWIAPHLEGIEDDNGDVS